MWAISHSVTKWAKYIIEHMGGLQPCMDEQLLVYRCKVSPHELTFVFTMWLTQANTVQRRHIFSPGSTAMCHIHLFVRRHCVFFTAGSSLQFTSSTPQLTPSADPLLCRLKTKEAVVCCCLLGSLCDGCHVGRCGEGEELWGSDLKRSRWAEV